MNELPGHVRSVDLLPFFESIGEIELDDWQRQVLDGLPDASLTFSGFFDAPRSNGLTDHTFTIYGRWFRKGRNRFVLRTRRWVPFDRRHHSRPENLPRRTAADFERLRRMTTSQILEQYEVWIAKAQRFPKIHSAYRLRSKKRRRGER